MSLLPGRKRPTHVAKISGRSGGLSEEEISKVAHFQLGASDISNAAKMLRKKALSRDPVVLGGFLLGTRVSFDVLFTRGLLVSDFFQKRMNMIPGNEMRKQLM